MLTKVSASEANVLERCALFEGLTAAQMGELRSVCRERRFEIGEFLFREGAPDPFLYVLIDGVAQLIKTTSIGSEPIGMSYRHPGEILGELKLVEPQSSSASIVAVTPVTVVEIDLDSFDSAALAEVRATLVRNVARILAGRLRATTSEGAEALQRELDETRARVHAGRFMVLMFAMVATYQLALAALVVVPGTVRPSLSVLSVIFVVWAVIPVVLSLRRSPFPFESYGLTLRRAGPIAVQALLWTVPLLLLVLVFKLALIKWLPSMADQPLFNPTAMFAGRPFDLGFLVFALGLYVIHAPAQELVARAGLQGALQNLIPTRPGSINWRAILIANLLFAAAHAFIDFWFCLAAFMPGLFWGWMFARQRSIVGVTASHIVVGIWANFVVGV